MILVTKVWCYDAELDEMGISSNEWLDFAIEMKAIKAIKLTGGRINATKDKATIYISESIDDNFVIDLDFETLLKLWQEWKKRAE